MTQPTTTSPVHPEMIGTPAGACAWCYSRTYGVALDCAWQNMADTDDADVDPLDPATAELWALGYVETGTVSAYFCDRHDPINSEA